MKDKRHIEVKRIVWAVEDVNATVYTAHTDKEESKVDGEMMAEFNPAQNYYLVPHTLH